MTEPLVSVLIPALEAAETIEAAVASVLAQDGVAVEVVIGADDEFDYLALLARAGLPLEAVRQVRTPHYKSGAAVARNLALQASRGTLIAALDADDQFAERRLARLAPLAERWGAATGPTVEYDAGGRWTRTVPDPEAGARTALGLSEVAGERMPFFPVFRRELAGDGWPKLPFAEDMIFNVELLFRSDRYAFEPDAAYRYYLRSGSLTAGRESLARAEDGYGHLLAHVEDAGWPPSAKDELRTIIGADLAAVRAVRQSGDPTGDWRQAMAAARSGEHSS